VNAFSRRPLLLQEPRAEIARLGRTESRDGAKQKRRCYQRRSGAPTRGTGPLRLALAGATRSGSAGVGSPSRDPITRLRRIKVESIGTTINFRPAAITHHDIAASTLLIASRLARVNLGGIGF
jgi:hypothetical protein